VDGCSATAVGKDMLLILLVISVAHVTNRGGIMSPGHCFNSKGMGMKSEACRAADYVLRKFKKHVSGKDVWRSACCIPTVSRRSTASGGTM